MLGPFTFTFILESEEFEKFEKLGCMYVIDHDNKLKFEINHKQECRKPDFISEIESLNCATWSTLGLEDARVREENWRTITNSTIVLWVDIASLSSNEYQGQTRTGI